LQDAVATSTCHAEYQAAYLAVAKGTVLRRLLRDLGALAPGPTRICEDNDSCIAVSENPFGDKRVRHMAMKYHYVREQVAAGNFRLVSVSSRQQLADLLTKPHPLPRHRELRGFLQGA
jgi:hypothetical protein